MSSQLGMNAVHNNFNAPLHASCYQGNERIVEQLIRRGADVNAPITTQLHQETQTALAINNVYSMKRCPDLMYFLDKRDSVNSKNKYFGISVSIYAIDVCKLFKHPTVINDHDINVEGSMKWDFDTCVDTPIKRMAGIDIRSINGTTGLMLSCFKGHDKVVKKLIQHGAEIDRCNDKGCTALIYACAEGHIGIVIELLKHKTDINVRDKDGRTPLMYACAHGHAEISRKLIDRGADTNARDKNGATALMHSCISGICPEIVKLIKICTNQNSRDRLMKTVFLHFCEKGYTSLVKQLIEKGVNLYCCDIFMKTALIYACENGHHAVVSELVQHDVYLDFSDIDGKTALSHACHNGHCSIVTMMLSKGSNVNAYDVMMKTPLMYSCENGHADIVDLLIKHDVDIKTLDSGGKSAEWYSKETPHIGDILRKAAKQSGSKTDGLNASDEKKTSSSMITPEEINSISKGAQCNVTCGAIGQNGLENASENATENQDKCDIFVEKNMGKSKCMGDYDKFIPVSQLHGECLPRNLQTKKDAIQKIITLTVKVEVGYVSEKRPFVQANGSFDPYRYDRGSKTRRYGSGTITSLLIDKPITNAPCPCRSCMNKKSGELENPWWELTVCTATHLIYNDEEAKFTTFYCFFDIDGGHGIKILYGRGIKYSITRIDGMSDSDLCEVLCVTHDEELVKKISGAFDGNSHISSFAQQPSEVIVSHPYAESKKMSFGKILHMTVPIKPSYETNTRFTFLNHTKCRLPRKSSKSKGSEKETQHASVSSSVEQTPATSRTNEVETQHASVSSSEEQTSATSRTNEVETQHASVSSSEEQTPATSRTNEVETQHASVSSSEEQTPATSRTNEVETQHASVSSSVEQTPATSRTNEVETQSSNMTKHNLSSSDFISDMLYGNGTNNYISIYLLLAMQGGVNALKFMTTEKTACNIYSRDDVIQHIMQEDFLREIKDNAKRLQGISVRGASQSNKSEVSKLIDSIIGEYNNLAKEDDLNALQNELFNIFFPEVVDIIFNQDNDGLTWNQNGQQTKHKYQEAFSPLIDFYQKVFEDIHPEYEIIENYLEKNFDEMMDFIICFMRRAIFYSLRKCPTDNRTDHQQPGSEFILPSGMMFILPSDAKYAFLYHNESSGWFTFPPGTQFALKCGKSVTLPHDAEFKNVTLYPKQCFVTYDTPTSPGSSGAAVFCNLLQFPFMTIFPHWGEQNGKRRSGIQTNRFCTLLENISRIFERIAISSKSKSTHNGNIYQ